MRALAKKLLEPIFTGFQWVTWMWASVLGEKANGSWERPTAVTAAILANEAISSQGYGRLLKRLETEDADATQTNTLSKVTFSNMSAGVTFYFVDSAIASKEIQLQLLWRCIGVFFADGIIHFSTSKIANRISKSTTSTSLEDLQRAFEVGVAAIAYVLGNQLAIYISDSNNIDCRSSKEVLSSLFIFLATALALPVSRCAWSGASSCCAFFQNHSSHQSQEDVEASELPQLSDTRQEDGCAYRND